jgi:hypothetical protein
MSNVDIFKSSWNFKIVISAVAKKNFNKNEKLKHFLFTSVEKWRVMMRNCMIIKIDYLKLISLEMLFLRWHHDLLH